MSITSSCGLSAGYEPIPGYRLQDMLGVGGFGEVWRVEAPGGLFKAIKIVHGALDEKRALRELRSLERIKGVHHPFLLTLERFEIVDGRLIIITELADGSLEDVFRRHCERGSCGIPRPALLGYLQDAADALDYLNEKFQLQHLDVKPGNLLMVGGHVKVGDFGLLKDLREVESSMVGGLTPIYAPPEVFDGRPCSTSDQYSLAVMYQELLTGTRPFMGRTIAQLATQHVHSAPNLEPLPPSDRPVLARALEKAPERRFGSCLEFVEALRAAESRGGRSRRSSDMDMGGDTQTGTLVGGRIGGNEPIEDLPSLSNSVSLITPTMTGHALVVGIGGTGAECLHLLRAHVASLYPTCALDLHSVLIDTDAETIAGARFIESTGRVPPCTSIYAPLRTSNQYRDSGTSHLASVSRRWVYNVPRSGQTEGLRPLGRLAMVDHAKNIRRQLAEAICHIAVVSGTKAPRVYIAGSLGGGTCGGMVWDIAHLIRHLLDEQDLAEANVTPILVTPGLQVNTQNPLSAADAHAALCELHHYMTPGNSYPGDEGADWPSVPSARSPLVNTYLVASDDASSSQEAGIKPVQMIAEYIWTDATEGGAILDAARASEGDENNSALAREPMIRSMGAAKLKCGRCVELPRLARSLSSRILREWLGRPSEAKQIAPSIAEKLSKRIGMDIDALRCEAWGAIAEDEAQRWVQLNDYFSKVEDLSLNPESVDNCIAGSGFELLRTMEATQAVVQRLVGELRREISVRIQDRRCDLTSAVASIECIKEALSSASEMHQLASPRRQAEAGEAAAALVTNARWHQREEMLGNSTEPGPLLRYAELRMRASVDQKLATLLPDLIVSLSEFIESLTDQAVGVAGAIKLLGEEQAASGGAANDPWKQLPPEIQGRMSKIEDAVHQLAIGNTLIPAVTDSKVLSDCEQLIGMICESATPVLEAVIEATEGSVEVTSESNQTAFESIQEAVQAIRPALLVAGGRQRLVLLVGTDAERNTLAKSVAEAHGGAISVVVIPGVSPTLIHEAQRIPVRVLLSRLQIGLGGDQKVLGRLQSRCDIRWNSDSNGCARG
jgi:hypothetical protein